MLLVYNPVFDVSDLSMNDNQCHNLLGMQEVAGAWPTPEVSLHDDATSA